LSRDRRRSSRSWRPASPSFVLDKHRWDNSGSRSMDAMRVPWLRWRVMPGGSEQLEHTRAKAAASAELRLGVGAHLTG
jgi:hypothetical protein